jgi:uncharacterized protein YigA (DUF484 family)
MNQPITSKLAIVAEQMNQYIREENRQLHEEVQDLAEHLSRANRVIGQLHSDIAQLVDHLADAQEEIHAMHRATRVLYTIDGVPRLFRRNPAGVFVEVADPPLEEPARNVARRLFEESDSDEESDDELMEQLMFGNTVDL